jgi:hypothetical protein
VLGFEVHCGDDTRRFLPLAAARLGGDEIAIASALTLVDELSFYRGRATSLRELRGRRVEEAGYPVGPLRDVVFGAGGAIAALVVEGDLEPVSIPFGAGVRVARGERSAPAA